MQPRGPSGAAVTRLMTKRRSTTRWAEAKPASTASRSPSSWKKHSLPGQPSQSRGAPGSAAAAGETTAGSGW